MTASKNTFGACFVGAVRYPPPHRRGLHLVVFFCHLPPGRPLPHEPCDTSTQHPFASWMRGTHTAQTAGVRCQETPPRAPTSTQCAVSTEPPHSPTKKPLSQTCRRRVWPRVFVVGFCSRPPHLDTQSTTTIPSQFFLPEDIREHYASVLGKPTSPPINRTRNMTRCQWWPRLKKVLT